MPVIVVNVWMTASVPTMIVCIVPINAAETTCQPSQKLTMTTIAHWMAIGVKSLRFCLNETTMPSSYARTWPNRLPTRILKLAFNLYPPFLGTGIWIKTIAPNFRRIEIIMKLHWYNKNYVGTHFGGSIFSMIDPYYMLMLMRNLGEQYAVWDKAASIDFKIPGRGTLHATFIITEEQIKHIREQADAREKYIFDLPIDILNEQGQVVASAIKTLYVKNRHNSVK
jgi:acyl-coenzyme A thioesterase PaaI-like protein